MLYYKIVDGLRVYLKHTNLNYFSVILQSLQTLEIKISSKLYLKCTSYEYSIFEVYLNLSRRKLLIKVYIIYGEMA